MLIDIGSLPRIADPDIRHGHSSTVPLLLHHVGWQVTFLRLVLVVQYKDGEFGLLSSALLFSRSLDILLQLLYSVLERGSRIIDLVYDQHILADQVGHFKGRQIEPLCSRDFGAGCLNWI